MAGYVIYSLDWDRFRQLVERPTQRQLSALVALVREGLEDRDGEFEEGDPILSWPTDVESLAQIVARRLALPDWYGDLSAAGKSLWEGVVFDACMDCDDIDLGFRADSDGVYWDVIEIAWKHLGVVPYMISEVALSAFGTRPYRYHQPPGPTKTRDEHDQEESERKASLRALSDTLGQFLEDVKQGEADLSPDKLLEQLQGDERISGQHKHAFKELLSDDDSEDDSAPDDDDSEDFSPVHSMHTPDEVEAIRAELQSAESAIQSSGNDEARTDFEQELMPAIQAIANDRRMLFIQVDT